jgi:hypothetical protein
MDIRPIIKQPPPLTLESPSFALEQSTQDVTMADSPTDSPSVGMLLTWSPSLPEHQRIKILPKNEKPVFSEILKKFSVLIPEILAIGRINSSFEVLRGIYSFFNLKPMYRP